MNSKDKGIEFTEIKKNRFSRRWGIKQDGKVVKMGYDFAIGQEIYEEMLKEQTNTESVEEIIHLLRCEPLCKGVNAKEQDTEIYMEHLLHQGTLDDEAWFMDKGIEIIAQAIEEFYKKKIEGETERWHKGGWEDAKRTFTKKHNESIEGMKKDWCLCEQVQHKKDKCI